MPAAYCCIATCAWAPAQTATIDLQSTLIAPAWIN
jgi:hypothetical protein